MFSKKFIVTVGTGLIIMSVLLCALRTTRIVVRSRITLNAPREFLFSELAQLENFGKYRADDDDDPVEIIKFDSSGHGSVLWRTKELGEVQTVNVEVHYPNYIIRKTFLKNQAISQLLYTFKLYTERGKTLLEYELDLGDSYFSNFDALWIKCRLKNEQMKILQHIKKSVDSTFFVTTARRQGLPASTTSSSFK